MCLSSFIAFLRVKWFKKTIMLRLMDFPIHHDLYDKKMFYTSRKMLKRLKWNYQLLCSERFSWSRKSFITVYITYLMKSKVSQRSRVVMWLIFVLQIILLSIVWWRVFPEYSIDLVAGRFHILHISKSFFFPLGPSGRPYLS